MPYAYITEWGNVGTDSQRYPLQAPSTPPVKRQKRIEITNKSQVSEPFNKGTAFISLVLDSACSLDWGKDPEADREFEKVHAGDHWYGVSVGDRLAIISNED